MKINRAFLSLSVLCLLALTGCDNAPRIGGPDIKMLAQATPGPPIEKNPPLLPLTKGNSWDMTAYCQTPATGANVKTQDRYVVTGPTMVDGLQGMEVEIQRGGKRWRREVYRMTGDTLELLAAQDENSDLMRYSPPLPLIKYPVHEGDSQLWHGEFRLNNMKLLSRAQCRVSAVENLKTPAGIFKTLRSDLMLVVNQNGRDIRFPSVRWFAPGVGFARRGYADQGRPAFAEVTKFNVR